MLRFEWRAKLQVHKNNGQYTNWIGASTGAFPALWTVNESSWPKNGEIDCLEAYSKNGNNSYYASNLFYGTKVDEDLLFVIEEKSNQIELTEKGVEYISGEKDKDFFVMPDIGGEIAKIESQNLDIEEEAELKEELFKNFTVKSERIHTMSQLL